MLISQILHKNCDNFYFFHKFQPFSCLRGLVLGGFYFFKMVTFKCISSKQFWIIKMISCAQQMVLVQYKGIYLSGDDLCYFSFFNPPYYTYIAKVLNAFDHVCIFSVDRLNCHKVVRSFWRRSRESPRHSSMKIQWKDQKFLQWWKS